MKSLDLLLRSSNVFHLAVQDLASLLDGRFIFYLELGYDLLHMVLHVFNLCASLVTVFLFQLKQVQVSFSFDLKIAFHLDDI